MRQVLALFSSPSNESMAALKKQGKEPVLPELQLMRELRQLQEAVPADRQDIRPATRFPSDVARALLTTRPRILQVCKHTVR
jgi:hypothetical protein